MAGTCFEYRIGAGVLAEDSPIEPINLYAAAKWSLYNVAERYCAAHECSLVWPRLFYLYGPMENQKRLVPYVIRNLLEGRRCPLTAGHQVRDFLHVSDVARAICEAALSSVEGPVNVGSGTPVTVAEVSREIGRQIGREELLEFGAQPTLAGDPGFICADSRRLRSETGWRPRHDLASGVRDTVEWWRARIQETGR
jgi:nucleoside-diphosphate-sugar epimerase